MEDKNNDIKQEELDSEREIMEPENVTREINLDELYDGAINNTVVIDPITKDEILVETKKSNRKIIGILFAVFILLILYFVNNKLDVNKKNATVEPNTSTTPVITTKKEVSKGILKCNYTSTSSSETQNATFEANYEDETLIDSTFNYTLMLIGDVSSDISESLKKEYEDLYINNVSVEGISTTFEKVDKGFAFSSKVTYKVTALDKITTQDGKTMLYVKPNSDDTLKGIQESYTNKGYSCSLLSSTKDGE